MKQVIVTGGRDYKDREAVRRALDFIRPDMVIEGGATGADFWAGEWAKDHKKDGVIHHCEPADWTKHGIGAGPIRNQKMLDDFPDAAVLAFPGRSGTWDCVRRAKRDPKRLILGYKGDTWQTTE